MLWSVNYAINASLKNALVVCNKKAEKNKRYLKYLKRVKNRKSLIRK